MNEEILFKPRVWHKGRKKYFEVLHINYNDETVYLVNGDPRGYVPPFFANFKDVTFEYPIGIIDKNGKMIYGSEKESAGDIARYKYCAGACDYDQINTFRWSPAGFTMEPIGAGLCSSLHNIPGGHMMGFKDNKNYLFEIIGNSNENPELMGPK